MLPQSSIVHHYQDARFPGLCRRGFIHHTILHPDELRPHLNRFINNGRNQLRTPENVNHIDGLGDRGEVRVALFAQHFLGHRIDRDYPVALLLHVPGDPMAVPLRIGR